MENVYVTAEQAAYKAYDIINGYYGGVRKRLHTRFPKLNKHVSAGFEYNTITTIAGLSSSGKTSLALMFLEDFITDNPKLKALVFSFEMSAEQNILKMLSSKLRIPMRDLYSADRKLEPDQVERIKQELARMKKYPIIFVDRSCAPWEIELMIKDQQSKLEAEESLAVFIDHTLLLKGVTGDSKAKATIDDLQNRLIDLKKLRGVIIFQLSQMNRNIKETSRITNPDLHYPMDSDISDSSTMAQASDILLCIHQPSILHITEYGPKHFSTDNKVFIHVVKNRFFGRMGAVERYDSDLEHNNLIEL